jgi:superfamily II DNA/RNA helicase
MDDDKERSVMQNFDALNLPTPLRDALMRLQFTTPTPIQAAAIPHILDGKDILGTAQTGTGKTGAFGIPLIAKLLTNPRSMALVMTPTRELAAQVMKMLQHFLGAHKSIRTALLIGVEAMLKQFSQLRARPRLVVGTPGRINDHLRRETLILDDANFLVLDETDRMLDMGFGVQIDEVLRYMPHERQTLLFSATMPANIVKLSSKYLKDPVRVSLGSTTTPIASISQENIQISEAEKYDRLLAQLDKREGSIIVFVKTKFGADRMAKKLRAMKHEADAIHGGLRQNRRDKAIAAFRNKNCRIMVATDVAARGLDIPHIEHVINYDLPQCPEDYIHRIGRTGRAGATGAAANLITPEDGKKWQAICRLLNPEAAKSSSSSPSPYKNKPKNMGSGARFRNRRKPARAGSHSY